MLLGLIKIAKLQVSGPQFGRTTRCMAVLCTLLVLFAAAVEIVHLHSDQGLSSAPCSICLTAHTTVMVFSIVVLPLMLALAAIVIPRFDRPHYVYAGFELFIRPPPSA